MCFIILDNCRGQWQGVAERRQTCVSCSDSAHHPRAPASRYNVPLCTGSRHWCSGAWSNHTWASEGSRAGKGKDQHKPETRRQGWHTCQRGVWLHSHKSEVRYFKLIRDYSNSFQLLIEIFMDFTAWFALYKVGF